MKNKVTFSVILPVYNVEKYLKACLDSIYNQTFKDFEIIAINDGSTDRCLNILNDYRDRYGKMEIITQENRGLSAARNVGRSHAKGEFICYIDSDDMISPMMLERVYNQFEEKVDIVAYDYMEVDEGFELSDFDKQKLYGSKPLKGRGEDVYISLSNDNKYENSACEMCIRRSFLDEIGLTFVEGIYYEDVMYTLSCYLKSKYMVYIDEQLYAYRKRMGSITSSKRFNKSVDSYISVLAQLIDFLGAENYDIKLEECVLNNIARKLLEEMNSKIFSLKDYQPIWKEDESPYWLSRAINVNACQEAFNCDYYLKGFERIIRAARRTMIYGAGGIGRMLGQYLKKEKMLSYIDSYCVTEKKGEAQIEGIQVREIEYIRNFDKDILIIIATNATAREMEKKVKDYGYYNYVIIDRLLENIIYNSLNSDE